MSESINIDFYKKLSYIGGILTIAFYLGFLIIAWILFPNDATPLDHWLSDFGRYLVPDDGGAVWRWDDILGWQSYNELGIGSIPNPGAIFYNLGCILGGVGMVAFFTGFLAYKNLNERIPKLGTYALIIIGIIGGFGLILIGIFAEDGIFFYINEELINPIHHTATIVFFLMLIIIKGIAGYWTWKVGLNRFIAVYAWVIIILDIILVATGNNYAIIEWLSVLLSLALIGIIASGLYLKDKK
jgi:hypothetical membrane protein